MNYKDNFELAYTNEHGETMTLKLDDKNNILIKHDDISATSNFVPLNREFVKNWTGTMSFEEVNALDKLFDTWTPREKYELINATELEEDTINHELIY